MRAAFAAATTAFVELVATVGPGDWERPGLGVWNVRELVGHTARALTTIEAYLATPAAGTPVDGPAGYVVAMLSDRVPPEQRRQQEAAIAARGREAGAALGVDAAASIAGVASRVRELVAATPDEAPVGSPVGPMRLIDYLPTRTFELTVHTLDLARALGVAPPRSVDPAIAPSLELAAAIAGRRARAADLLLLMTGREGLPQGLTVL